MSLNLGQKVGPMPLGVWLIVGAGGIFVAYRSQMSGASAPAPAASDALPTGGGTGEVGSFDGAPVVLSPIIRVKAPVVNITNKLPDPTPAPTPAPKPSTHPSVPPKKKPNPPAKPAPVKATPAPKRGRTHTVQPHDTLWDLAGHYYHNPLRWASIYSKNRATIEAAAKRHGRSSSSHGHWIYPGTVLVIP